MDGDLKQRQPTKRRLVGCLTGSAVLAFIVSAVLLIVPSPEQISPKVRITIRPFGPRVQEAARATLETHAKSLKAKSAKLRSAFPLKERAVSLEKRAVSLEKALSAAEYAEVQEEFAQADSDHDGCMSLAEMIVDMGEEDAPPLEFMTGYFAHVDTDGDKCISLAEFAVMCSMSDEDTAELTVTILFNHGDTNHDGKLDLPEMTQVFHQLGVPEGQVDETGGALTAFMFRMMDADGNDFISKEEFARMESMNSTAQDIHAGPEFFDTDSDGFVTADEMYAISNMVLDQQDFTMGHATLAVIVADKDNDGKLNYAEMQALLDGETEEPDPDSVFDLDRDGFTTEAELDKVFNDILGLGIHKDMLQVMIFKADMDGDKKLNSEELSSMMATNMGEEETHESYSLIKVVI